MPRRRITGSLVGLALISVLLAFPADSWAAGKTYWAVVNPDGTLARSTPGASVTVTASGYDVRFPKPVSGCAMVASEGLPGASSVFLPRQFSAQVGTNPRVVRVFPENPLLAFATAPFHLQVFCNPKGKWVVIDPSGATAWSGVPVTTRRISTGYYQVEYPKKITTCGSVASNGDFYVPGSGAVADGRLIT